MTKARKSKWKPGDTLMGSSYIKRSGRGGISSWRNRNTGKIVIAKGKVSEKKLDWLSGRSKTREVTNRHVYGYDRRLRLKPKKLRL